MIRCDCKKGEEKMNNKSLHAAMMMFQYTDYIVYPQVDNLYKVMHFPNGVHCENDFCEIVPGEEVIDFAIQYLKTGTIKA
jgi:hypothetical protein